jgi:molybdopterin-guanine dinucleotide biosynthesis protein A
LSLLRGLTPDILIVAGNGRTWPDDIRIVADLVPDAGALGGLYTALMEAQTDQVLVLACDMPFLTASFLTCIIERGRRADAAVPRDAEGRLHPLCASYSRRAAGHIAAQIAGRHLRIADALIGLAIREIGPEDLARFDSDGRLLLNINPHEDYARACRLHAGGEAPIRPPA